MKQTLGILIMTAALSLAAQPAVEIQTGNVLANGVEFTLSAARRDAIPVTVMLRSDGKVLFAEAAFVPPGRLSHRHVFSPEFSRAASGRKAELLLTAASGANTLALTAEFSGSIHVLPRTVNHGVYIDGQSKRHAWYLNHASEYVFDGEVYFPVGGMLCPRLPGNTSAVPPKESPTGWAKRKAEDADVFDRMLAYGLNDVYINLGSWAPVPQIQEFVDLMESRGIRYGWQLNTQNGGTIPSYFITFDRANAPKNWQGTVRGEYRAGKIRFPFSREYNAIGFLLTDGRRFCRSVTWQDRDGVDVRPGIDVDGGKDFSKQREITLEADLPLPDGTPLTVLPLLAAKMRHPNLWNPKVRAGISRKFEWVKEVKWGPGFRFFVDPVVNEGNMLNATENLRQHTPEINHAFQLLLEEKYSNLPALQDAWKCAVPDFAAASRLVPLRDGDTLLLLDPETETIYPSELASSQMWPDYNAMIRRSYTDLLDEISVELKQIVNLPVVNKSVGVTAEDLHISHRDCGSDGVGYEVYLNHGCPQEASGGGAVAAAAATPHTVWTLATEAGFSAKPGNGGHRFFPDEKTLNELADSLHSMGANGLFFFGVKLPGIWKDHSVYDLPEKLEWLGKLKKRLSGRAAAPQPRTFLYPAGYTWWYWSDQSRALYDAPRGEIAQSLRLPTGEWAYATHILPDSAEEVVLHLPRPPYSLQHAEQVTALLGSGKEIIYVGSREDLGTIPELDRFFTGETIAFADGSQAQELTPLPGSKVLTAENGRPWAIRHGKLLIVSRSPVTPSQRNRDLGFSHLKQEWLSSPQK